MKLAAIRKVLEEGPNRIEQHLETCKVPCIVTRHILPNWIQEYVSGSLVAHCGAVYCMKPNQPLILPPLRPKEILKGCDPDTIESTRIFHSSNPFGARKILRRHNKSRVESTQTVHSSVSNGPKEYPIEILVYIPQTLARTMLTVYSAQNLANALGPALYPALMEEIYIYHGVNQHQKIN